MNGRKPPIRPTQSRKIPANPGSNHSCPLTEGRMWVQGVAKRMISQARPAGNRNMQTKGAARTWQAAPRCSGAGCAPVYLTPITSGLPSGSPETNPPLRIAPCNSKPAKCGVAIEVPLMVL